MTCPCRRVWQRWRIVLAHAGVLLLVVLQASCAGRQTAPSSLTDPQAFIAAMRQAGVHVREGQETGPEILGLTPQSIFVGEERLWVYQALEPLERQDVVNAFTSDPFVWVNERLIVQYEGHDGGTILVIEGLLGEALIKPPVAGEEPYPPAVTAAIRAVAQEYATDPAEIVVLAYEMRQWRDDCLELRDPPGNCEVESISGWLIELQYEAMVMEVHTDLLGETIRWRVR